MCSFTVSDGVWTCSRDAGGCGYVYRPSQYGTASVENPPRRVCGIRGNGDTKLPGSRLSRIIKFLFGQKAVLGCGCTSKINEMNAWGPAGCREHLDEIVDWLTKVATDKKWVLQSTETEPIPEDQVGQPVPQTIRTRWARRIAQVTASLGGETLIRWQCRQAVKLAIWQSEKDLSITDAKL